MNKIFKVIFNRVTNRHEVVAEFARNRVKSSSGTRSSSSLSSVLMPFKLSLLSLIVLGVPTYAIADDALVIKDPVPSENSSSTSDTDTETITKEGSAETPSDTKISKKYAGYQAGGGKTDVSFDPSVWSTPDGFNENVHRGVIPKNIGTSTKDSEKYTGSNEKYANSRGTVTIGGGFNGAETHSIFSVAVGDSAYAKGVVTSLNYNFYVDGEGNFLPYNPSDTSKLAVRNSNGGTWSGPATAMGNYARADGASAAAYGNRATAQGSGTTALGSFSNALANNSLALGSSAKALATNSIAEGRSAKATAKSGVAIGSYARVGYTDEIKAKEKELKEYALFYNNRIASNNGKTYNKQGYEALEKELQALYEAITNATALGNSAVAASSGSTALGALSEANAERATAVGGWAKADSQESTALGSVAFAFGEKSTALGDSATATGERSTATGFVAKAGGYGAVAMGNNTYAGWTTAMEEARQARNTLLNEKKALQTQLDAAKKSLNTAYTDDNASDITTYTKKVADLQASVDVKEKAIQQAEQTIKDSAGKSNEYYGQIAIGNSANASGNRSVAIGRSANAGVTSDPTNTTTNPGLATALGDYAQATNNYATALGSVSTASGNGAVAVGNNTNATEQSTTALGTGANATAEYATALGSGSKASGHSAVAVGNGTKATGNQTTALGTMANAAGTNATALGRSAKAYGEHNLAVGYHARATHIDDINNDTPTAGKTQPNQATAIGNHTVVAVDNSVALGYNSRVTDNDKVTAGQTSYLTNKNQSNVGIVSVGQTGLTLVRRITAVADGVKDDDAVTVAQLKKVQLNGGGALAYTANGSTSKQTTPLTDGLDFKVKDSNLTVEAGDSGAVTYGLSPTLTNITSISGGNGSDNKPTLTFSGDNLALNNKKITGVATGEADTDAVNVKQLNEKFNAVTAAAGNGSTTTVQSSTLDVKDTGSSGNHAYSIELKGEDQKKLEKIGTGEVADGNEATVTGDKVYDSLTTLKAEGFQVNGDKGGKQKQSLGTEKTLSIVGTANEIETTTSSDNDGNAKVTLKLAEKVKTDIANAAAKSVDLSPYAKTDATNIDPSTWRNKLDVYNKSETDTAIKNSRTEVVGKDGITVTPNQPNSTGKTTYTVGLDEATKAKIEAAASNTGSITTVESTDLEVSDSTSGTANHAYTLNLKSDLKNKIENAANKKLDNLDPAGTTKIKTLAKEAVSVVDGTNTKATYTDTGDNRAYKVDVAGDLTGITSITGNGPKVAFNKDGIELNNQKITGLTAGTDGTDAVNVDQLTTAVKASKEKVTNKDGTIEVTEGEPTSGEGKNFVVGLSKAYKDKIDQAAAAATTNAGNLSNKADTNLSNISPEGKKVIKDLITLKNGTNTTVTETQNGDTKEYAVNVDLSDYAKTDASNIPDNKVENWVDKLSGDSVVEPANTEKGKLVNEKGLVDYVKDKLDPYSETLTYSSDQSGTQTLNLKTGTLSVKGTADQITTTHDTQGNIKVGLASSAVEKLNKIDDKLDKNLGNLDETGKGKIQEIAKNSVEVKAGDSNTTVSKEDGENGKEIYKVSVNLEPYAKKSDLAGKADAADVIKADGTNVAGNTNFVDAIEANAKLTYKANGNNKQEVALSEGLNFKDGKNTTATVSDNGAVTFDVKPTLTDMTSISGNGTTLTFTADGATLGNKKLSGLKEGDISATSTDAVTGKQLNTIASNTIKLTGDSGTTNDQRLDKSGGISFKVEGDADISTTASESKVALKLNKGSVANGDNRVVSGDTVNKYLTDNYYTQAQVDAKAKASKEKVTSDDKSITVVEKNGAEGEGKTFDLSLSDTLKNQIGNTANKDLDNLTDEGKKQIKTQAKEAVSVIAGKNTTVTPADNGDNRTYAVNVQGDLEGITSIKGNGSKVSFNDGAVDLGSQKITGLAKGVNGTDAVNVDQLNTAVNTSKEKVTSGDDTIKVEAKEGAAGEGKNFVVSLGDTYKNKIDEAAKTAADNATNKANISLNNIDDAGKKVIKDLITLKDGTNTTVSETETNGAKEYRVNVDLSGYAKTDASNIDDGNVENWVNKLSGDTVVPPANTEKGKLVNEKGLVNYVADELAPYSTTLTYSSDKTGTEKLNLKDGTLSINGTDNQITTSHDASGNIKVGLAESAVKKLAEIDNKLNKDLTNLDKTGEDKIKDLAKNSVEVQGGNNTTVSKEAGADGKQIYKVNVDLEPYAKKTDLDTKANVNEVIKSDGSNVANNEAFTNAIAANTKLAYKANGKDGQSVSLANGLNFTNGKNTTASVNADGVVSFAVDPALADITSISGKGSTLTFDDNGLSLNNRTLTGLKDGTVDANSTDAVTGRQLNAIASNTIKLTGDSGTTDTQSLNKQDGISFKVEGNDDIITKASDSKVALSLSKGEIADNDSKVVSGDTVKKYLTNNYYNKTEVEEKAKASKETVVSSDSSITVTPKDGTNGEGKTFDVALSSTLQDKINKAADKDTVDAALANKANKSLDNLDPTGTSKVKTLAKEAVSVADGTNTKVRKETSGENDVYKVDVKGDLTEITSIQGGSDSKKVEFTNAGVNLNSQKLTGLAEGTADSDAVNVAQLNKQALSYSSDKGDKATLNLKDGTLTIKGTTDQVVTSHDTNGNITVSLAEKVNTTLADVANKANKTLDNLDPEGKKVIQDLAKESIEVKEGNNTTVTTSEEGGKKVYKVNVDLASYATKDEVAKKADQDLGNINAEGRKVITNLVKGQGDNYLNVTENVDGNTGVKTLNVAAKVAEDLSPENGLDNQLVSAKAAKTYTDGVSLNTTGDEGTGSVNLKSQRLAVKGATGEIKTTANAQGITIALDDKVKNEIAGKADKTYVEGNFVKSDGTNVNNAGFLSAVQNHAKLSYKANNGGAETVSLAKGLDFTNGTNTTATVKADGVVTFDVNKALTGMTSIAGNGTTLEFTADGISLGEKKITGLAQGTNSTDAVNVEQLDNAKKAITAAIDAVTLTASDGNKDTTPINLKSGKLAIVGRDGIKTTATDNKIEVALADAEKQKLDTLGTGTVTKGDQLTVTGGAVATALENKANTNMDNLTADGKKAVANLVTGTNTNAYTSVTNTENATTGGRNINVGVNVADNLSAGEEALKDKVASAQAAKTYTDSLVLSAEGDTGSGASTNVRTGKLKVKGQENEITTDATGDTLKIGLAKAVTDKIDAKADKADVEANYIKKDGSNVAGSDAFINAIQDNAKLTYKQNGQNDKSVSLAKGLNFVDGTNTTAETGADGVVKFNVKPELTDITSISGKGTTITLEADKVSLNNKVIGGVANATQDDQAVNLGQLNKTAKDAKEELKAYADQKADAVTLTATDGTNSTNAINLKTGKLGILGGDGLTAEASGNNITVSLDQATRTKLNEIGTGAIADGNNLTVTGDTVSQALKKKADLDLGNINDAGKTKVKTLAQEAVKLENGQNTTVESRTENGDKIYKVNVDLSNYATNEALNKKANKNLDDITDEGKTVIKNLITGTGDDYIDVKEGAGANGAKSLNVTAKVATDLTPDAGLENKLATAQAAKAYTDKVALTTAGNSGTGSVNLKSQTLSVTGADGEITTVADQQGIKVSLADAMKQTINNKADKTYVDGNFANLDGSNFTGSKLADVIRKTVQLGYKANNAATGFSVSLEKGLDFTNGTNTTTEVAADGVVKVNVNPKLNGITSISNNAKGQAPGTVLDITDNGLTLNDKVISGVKDGVKDNDAATVGQVNRLGNNTLTLTGDKKTATDAQKLNKEGGLSFAITGNDDISTAAADSAVALSLNKGTVSDTEEKVVSGKSVYTAIEGSKATVVAKQDDVIEVVGNKSAGINGDTFTVGLNQAALEKKLDPVYAKTDLSNINKAGEDKVKSLIAAGKADDFVNVTVEDQGLNTPKTFKIGVNKADDLSNGALENKLATASAAKNYTDTQVAAVTLNTDGDDSTQGSVNLAAQRLAVKGKNGEIKTEAKGNEITIALDQAIKDTINAKADKAEVERDFLKADGTNLAGSGAVAAIEKNAKLTYLNNDGSKKTVSLEQGLNFKNGKNTTAVTEDNGVVKVDLNARLEDIERIGNSGTTLDVGADGITLNTKKIKGVQDATDADEAVNLGQLNTAKKEVKDYADEAVENAVNAVTLTATDGTLNTEKINLKTEKLGIIGENGITTTVDGKNIKVALGSKEKAILDSVGTGKVAENDGNTVTGDTVYNALQAKADTNLGNITEDGKKVISDLVEGKAGNKFVTVTNTTDAEKKKIITVTPNVSDNLNDADLGNKLVSAQGAKTYVDTALANKTITYKANSAGDQSVKLSEGLDFTSGTNTTATVKADGVVTFDVNKALKDMTSIGGNGTTVTFTDAGIALGNKKITGLGAGSASTDAVNVGQLNSEVDKAKKYAEEKANAVTMAVSTGNGGVTERITLATENLDLVGKDGIVTEVADNKKGINVKLDPAYKEKIDKMGTGKVEAGNTYTVTGDTVNTALSTRANTDLSNLTTAGQSAVKNLAKEAVQVENGKNTAVSSREDNGNKIYKVDVAGDLKEVTSISNRPAEVNTGTVVTLSDDGLSLNDKVISGVKAGTKDGDAVNVKQLKAVSENTFALGGDLSTKTDTQTLSKDGGLKFDILGNDDISTSAGGSAVNLSLNKGTVSAGDNKVVSGKSVFEAIEGAKVTVNPKDDLITVAGEKSNGITGDTFTIGLNETKLKEKLNDVYAKTDLSNLNSAGKGVVKGLVEGEAADSYVNIENVAGSADEAKKIRVSINAADDLSQSTLEGKLATAKAAKAYTNERVAEVTLNTAGDGNTKGSVKLAYQTLSIKGTEGEITTNASGQGITLALDKAIKDKIDGKADKTYVDENFVKTDGSNLAGTDLIDAISRNVNLTYKANGKDEKAVSLKEGLNFTNGTNTTATVSENGGVTFSVNPALNGITSISNNANGAQPGTVLELTNDGIVLNDKVIRGVANPTGETDAVNLRHFNTLANNTLRLGGDGKSLTNTQALNKSGGLTFNILGGDDIKTEAAGDGVTLSLKKGEVVNTDNGKRVVSGSQVFDAIKGAKTVVAKEENSVITVSGNTTDDITGNTFTVGLDEEALKEKLNSVYAKTNLSNIDNAGKETIKALVNGSNTDGFISVTNQPGATGEAKNIQINLNTADDLAASGEDPLKGKVATAKAAKKYTDDRVDGVTLNTAGNTGTGTVKLLDGTLSVTGRENEIVTTANNGGIEIQLAEKVKEDIAKKADKTEVAENYINKDGTNADSAGFVKAVEDNVKLAYKHNGADKKTVKLSEGLDFTDGTNTTAEIDENGVVKVNLKSQLAGITKISGNGTALSLTQDGLDVGNKKITRLADGVKDDDAVNLGQVKNLAKASKETVSNEDGSIKVETKASETGEGSTFVVSLSDKTNEKLGKIDELTDDVNKVAQNTLTLSNGKGQKATAQRLDKEGGLVFEIKGDDDITSNATSEGIALSLNKGDVRADENRVISGKTAYSAIVGAKAKVVADEKGMVTVSGDKTDDLAGNTFKIKVNAATDLNNSDLDNKVASAQAAKDYTDKIGEEAKAYADSVAGDQLITYKANDANRNTVKLSEGLNFTDSDNINASVGTEGKVTFALKDTLTGVSSISNSKIGANRTLLTLSDAGLTLNNKKITGLLDGAANSDAVNYGQLKSVTLNTLKLGGDDSTFTTEQQLNKRDGLTFNFIGGDDITTNASGDRVTFSLDKADGVKAGEAKVVSSDKVYQAIKTAKPTIVAAQGSGLTVTGSKTEDIQGNTFTLDIDADALSNKLGDRYLKSDLTNLNPDGFTKLVNVEGQGPVKVTSTGGTNGKAKSFTVSLDTVDSLSPAADTLAGKLATAKATKTYIDNLTLSTQADEGTGEINLREGKLTLNGEKGIKTRIGTDGAIKIGLDTENLGLAFSEGVSLTYKANTNAEGAKTVTLSKGLDFVDGTNTTATIGDSGKVTFDLKDSLTGMTSISGPLDPLAKPSTLTFSTGGFNFNGGRLMNLGDAADNGDAVSFGYLKSVLDKIEIVGDNGITVTKSEETKLDDTVKNKDSLKLKFVVSMASTVVTPNTDSGTSTSNNPTGGSTAGTGSSGTGSSGTGSSGTGSSGTGSSGTGSSGTGSSGTGDTTATTGTTTVPANAITKEQLEPVLQNFGKAVSNQIAASRQEARSGTALAIATASLPQSYMPGRSMVAVAGGSFKGENAVALGVSRVSDNGKVVFKLNGSMSSRGNPGVGAGIGYIW